jgi:hypothetical protein
LDCVSKDNEVSVGFSYDLDDIDESSSGGGVYEFAQAWPDNFLTISISSACNGLTWTSGESFSIFIEDGSFDLFHAVGEPLFQEFPAQYGEPTLMGFQLLGSNGEMITMENGPGPVPFFSIHPQHIDDGWGLIGQIGAEDWYIEFTINTWQINEEPDMNTVAVPVDISPEVCPNRLKMKESGILQVGILGTADLDVTEIDPVSVTHEGVSALRWHFEDVATPMEPYTGKLDCQEDCTTEGPDGLLDLVLMFERDTITGALGTVENGECRVLRLEGSMMEEFGGTYIGGQDVMVIEEKKEKKEKKK